MVVPGPELSHFGAKVTKFLWSDVDKDLVSTIKIRMVITQDLAVGYVLFILQ